MTEENKRVNILQEIERAAEALSAAELLLQHRLYADAVSRAYYHALYFGRALLLAEGLEAKTHSGVVHLLHLHFVRTGKLDARVAHFFGEVQDERIAADYDSAVVYTEEIVREKLERARTFGEAAREVLRTAGYI